MGRGRPGRGRSWDEGQRGQSEGALGGTDALLPVPRRPGDQSEELVVGHTPPIFFAVRGLGAEDHKVVLLLVSPSQRKTFESVCSNGREWECVRRRRRRGTRAAGIDEVRISSRWSRCWGRDGILAFLMHCWGRDGNSVELFHSFSSEWGK